MSFSRWIALVVLAGGTGMVAAHGSEMRLGTSNTVTLPLPKPTQPGQRTQVQVELATRNFAPGSTISVETQDGEQLATISPFGSGRSANAISYTFLLPDRVQERLRAKNASLDLKFQVKHGASALPRPEGQMEVDVRSVKAEAIHSD
jgi:hypothetical protein